MGLYVVTEPVVIDGLHYATVPADPIEVGDELAAPLVEAGSLVPFRAPVVHKSALDWSEVPADADRSDGPYADPEQPAKPSRARSRKPAEDQ